MQKTLAKLFDVHPNTIGNWKKEGRLGFLFFEKYFSKKDIEEFIETGSIEKLESLDNNFYLLEMLEDLISPIVRHMDDLFSLIETIEHVAKENHKTGKDYEKIFLAAIEKKWSKKIYLIKLANINKHLSSWIINQAKNDFPALRHMSLRVSTELDLLLLVIDSRKKEINALELSKLLGKPDPVVGYPYTLEQIAATRSQIL